MGHVHGACGPHLTFGGHSCRAHVIELEGPVTPITAFTSKWRHSKASGAEVLELRKGLLGSEIAGKSSKLRGAELRQRALRGWAAVRSREARREAKERLGLDEFRMMGRVFCEGGRRLCVTKVTRDGGEGRVVHAEDMDRWTGPGAQDNKEERFPICHREGCRT